jgi:hypothetical protein
MKRQHLFRIGVVLAAIVLAIGLLWIVLPSGQISRTAYSRIQEGMSEKDVLGILVLPPGNYATDFYTAVSQEQEGQTKYGKRLGWIGDQAMINVEFDDRGQVCWKSFHEIQTRRSFPQRIKSLWWSVRRLF